MTVRVVSIDYTNLQTWLRSQKDGQLEILESGTDENKVLHSFCFRARYPEVAASWSSCYSSTDLKMFSTLGLSDA